MQSRTWALRGLVCGISLWAAAGAQASFTVGLNVPGTNITQLGALNGGFSFIPPDTTGAIGPNHFVEFTNGSFSVYNRTTGALLGSRTALTSFWTNAGVSGLSLNPVTGTGTTDPRVLYDPFSNRWFATAIDTPATGANRILVAVSSSSDPTSTWKAFGITSNTSGAFADFPTLGMNADALYVGTNNFGDFSVDVGITVIPKAGLLLGTPTVAGATVFQGQSPSGTGYTPSPVVDMNNGSGSNAILSDYNMATGFLRRTNIINTNTPSPSLSTSGGLIAVTPASAPPLAHQSGANDTIDTGDTRFSGSVILQGGKIWGVQVLDVGGRSAIRWYRINASTNALEESGTISSATRDYYFPSIAVNASGDVVIGYSGSSDSEYASSFASVGKYNGASTTFATPTLLKAGVGNYNITFGGPSNRWGDYSQTTIDPNDPSHFWTIQEWASATNVWSTEITEIIITPLPEPAGLPLLAVGLLLLCRRPMRSHWAGLVK